MACKNVKECVCPKQTCTPEDNIVRQRFDVEKRSSYLAFLATTSPFALPALRFIYGYARAKMIQYKQRSSPVYF